MKDIKDLEILTNDAEKIAKFAKLFARLPEILRAMHSQEVYLRDVTTAAEKVKADLAAIDEQLAGANFALSVLERKIKEAEERFKSADAMAAQKIADVENQIAVETKKLEAEQTKRVSAAKLKAEQKIEQIQSQVKASEANFDNQRDRQTKVLNELAAEESAILEKIELAKEMLAKIKNI